MKDAYVIKVGPKALALIGAAFVFFGAVIGIYVSPELGKVVSENGPKLFVVETVSGTTVVSATEVQ